MHNPQGYGHTEPINEEDNEVKDAESTDSEGEKLDDTEGENDKGANEKDDGAS